MQKAINSVLKATIDPILKGRNRIGLEPKLLIKNVEGLNCYSVPTVIQQFAAAHIDLNRPTQDFDKSQRILQEEIQKISPKQLIFLYKNQQLESGDIVLTNSDLTNALAQIRTVYQKAGEIYEGSLTDVLQQILLQIAEKRRTRSTTEDGISPAKTDSTQAIYDEPASPGDNSFSSIFNFPESLVAANTQRSPTSDKVISTLTLPSLGAKPKSTQEEKEEEEETERRRLIENIRFLNDQQDKKQQQLKILNQQLREKARQAKMEPQQNSVAHLLTALTLLQKPRTYSGEPGEDINDFAEYIRETIPAPEEASNTRRVTFLMDHLAGAAKEEAQMVRHSEKQITPEKILKRLEEIFSMDSSGESKLDRMKARTWQPGESIVQYFSSKRNLLVRAGIASDTKDANYWLLLGMGKQYLRAFIGHLSDKTDTLLK